MFTVPLVCGEAGSGESSGPLLFVDGACLLEGVCTVFGFPITIRLKHSSIKHCKLSKSSSSFSRVFKSIQICLPVLFLLLFKDVGVNWQRKLVTNVCN